jgi:hypothetical protein
MTVVSSEALDLCRCALVLVSQLTDAPLIPLNGLAPGTVQQAARERNIRDATQSSVLRKRRVA